MRQIIPDHTRHLSRLQPSTIVIRWWAFIHFAEFESYSTCEANFGITLLDWVVLWHNTCTSLYLLLMKSRCSNLSCKRRDGASCCWVWVYPPSKTLRHTSLTFCHHFLFRFCDFLFRLCEASCLSVPLDKKTEQRKWVMKVRNTGFYTFWTDSASDVCRHQEHSSVVCGRYLTNGKADVFDSCITYSYGSTFNEENQLQGK